MSSVSAVRPRTRNLPRRLMLRIVCPQICLLNCFVLGVAMCRFHLIVTRSMRCPTHGARRARTMVSTSGSSGMNRTMNAERGTMNCARDSSFFVHHSSFVCRQPEYKIAPAAGRIFHLDLAAVLLHHQTTEGQSQPRAFAQRPAAVIRQLDEFLEDAFLIFVGDA